MRVGNFTSSSIWMLMTNGSREMTEAEIIEHRKKNPKSKAKTINDGLGKPAQTYIKHKNRELLLGRNLQKERSSRPTSWGNLIERRVYELLPLDYTLQSDVRYTHSEFERWTGAPDMLTDLKVCDIKCPFSLDVYCDKADIMMANDVEALKKEFPENYWQLVSNAILTEKNIGELIIYCPYIKELIEIKEDLVNYEGDQNDVAWINWAKDEELPYLIEGNYYKNLYKFEFEIPEEDKQALYDRVKLACSL